MGMTSASAAPFGCQTTRSRSVVGNVVSGVQTSMAPYSISTIQ